MRFPAPQLFGDVSAGVPAVQSSKALYVQSTGVASSILDLLHWKFLVSKTVVGNFTDINLDMAVCSRQASFMCTRCYSKSVIGGFCRSLPTSSRWRKFPDKRI